MSLRERQRQYIAKVDAFIDSLADLLSPDEIAQVRHLHYHGESGEAMIYLAWYIVDGNKSISRYVYESIKEHSGWEINQEHMPPDLAKHVIDED